MSAADPLIGSIKSLGEVAMPFPGNKLSKAFLDSIQCPDDTTALVLKVDATGVLQCKALVWTKDSKGISIQTERTWDVHLKTTDPFYKLLVGKLK